jgi:5-methylcytosine-specific restriction endonuclease McrA
MSQYKTCGKCDQTKALDLFAKNKRTSDGLQAYCKVCQKSYRKPEENKKYLSTYRKEKRDILLPKKRINSRIYYANNRAKVLEKQRASYDPVVSQKKTSIRRARLHANPVYKVTNAEIRELRNQACFYCGGKGGAIDHVIPVSRGGGHSIGNLLPSCQTCNSSKADKFIVEWKNVRGW